MICLFTTSFPCVLLSTTDLMNGNTQNNTYFQVWREGASEQLPTSTIPLFDQQSSYKIDLRQNMRLHHQQLAMINFDSLESTHVCSSCCYYSLDPLDSQERSHNKMWYTWILERPSTVFHMVSSYCSFVRQVLWETSGIYSKITRLHKFSVSP